MTLSEEFLSKGIVKVPSEGYGRIGCIRDAIKKYGQHYLDQQEFYKEDYGLNGLKYSLNALHHYMPKEKLNEFRIFLINSLNGLPWFRENYFSIAKNALHELVGNELVMQRNINLSIQLPHDDSSLLPVHCDTWSGDSPYEVVLWIPLVDCHGTKSMYFCDKAKDAEIQPLIAKYKNSEDLFKAIEPHVIFMDVKYGEALIFTQNIMHGNRINTTDETRWSLNCRFKSLFSPYADKKLGEFFEPIEIRPATRLGMAYELPRV